MLACNRYTGRDSSPPAAGSAKGTRGCVRRRRPCPFPIPAARVVLRGCAGSTRELSACQVMIVTSSSVGHPRAARQLAAADFTKATSDVDEFHDLESWAGADDDAQSGPKAERQEQ